MRSWNEDPFTKKARREHFEARSVYKLMEIDRRERLLTGAKRVLDLGAAPGSWVQYCLEKLPHAEIFAVDLAPLNLSDPRVHFHQGSIEDTDLSVLLGNQGVDVLISDMAPKTSGIHDRDTALSYELATLALDTAVQYLRPGGNFVVKLFMGAEFEEFQKRMRKHFAMVKLLRPESTRKRSREIFFIGKDFRENK